MHTVFALLCFVVVIHWLIFPYPSGLLHWHCGNLTIAPVPAKQHWWIWINTSCEFIMNDCITTTKQSTTKPCAYFLGYTVYTSSKIISWRQGLICCFACSYPLIWWFTRWACHHNSKIHIDFEMAAKWFHLLIWNVYLNFGRTEVIIDFQYKRGIHSGKVCL